MHIYVCRTCCVFPRIGHIMHVYRYIVIAPRVKTFRYVYQFTLYFPNSNAMIGLRQTLLFLTHWGRVTHICVSNLTIIVSDNGLSPGRRQAIIWTNAGILLIGHLGTNFNEILIGIQTFSFKKLHLKTSSAKWRPFCLGLNELRNVDMVCYGRCVVPGAITLTSQWHEPLLFHGACADIRKTSKNVKSRRSQTGQQSTN